MLLQDGELARFIADQVSAGDIHVAVLRHEKAAHLTSIRGGAQHQLPWRDAIGQNLLVAIDVGQEEVQGAQSLGQPRFDLCPLGRVDDAREEVRRDDPLGRAFGAVDREGDALQQKGLLKRLLPVSQLRRGQCRDARLQRGIVRAHRAVAREHFVVGPAGPIEGACWKEARGTVFGWRHAGEAPSRVHYSIHAAIRRSRQATAARTETGGACAWGRRASSRRLGNRRRAPQSRQAAPWGGTVTAAMRPAKRRSGGRRGDSRN